MSAPFYRAFEDEHRGSRTLIKTRLAAYLPFLLPLVAAGERPSVLDLGCGRGEWLELLTENGFAARGVDLDAGMLEACRERGLDADIGDALSALRAQPDSSLSLVSAFHLVEHIPFDAVQDLICQALRVLQPGGLLIMETPNPENLVVGTSGFYMDPSHLKPIPPLLLDFVVGYVGFERHKVVRLQEPAQLHGESKIELVNVLDSVSPDYSVVAQKNAPADLMALHDTAFDADFGLKLSQLAGRYDAQRDQAQHELVTGLAALRSETEAIRAELHRLRETEDRALRTEQELEIVRQSITYQIEQLRLHGERELEAVRQQGQQHLEIVRQNGEYRLEVVRQRGEQQIAQLRESNEQQIAQLRESNEQQIAQLRESNEQQIAQLRESGERQVAELRQHGEQQLETVRLQAQAQLEQARAAALTMEEHLKWKLNVMTARAEAAEYKVNELYASTSWRVTRPARAVVNLMRSPRRLPEYLRRIRHAVTLRTRAIAGRVVRKAVSSPRIRGFALRTVARYPALDRRSRALAYRVLHAPPPVAPGAPANSVPGAPVAAHQNSQAPAQLSRSAQKIFAELTIPPHDDTTPF